MSAAAHELAPDVAAGLSGFAAGEPDPEPGGVGAFAVAGAAHASAQTPAATIRTGRRSILPLVSSVPLSVFSLSRVEPRIEPEPDEAERRAILAALERTNGAAPGADRYRSGWREAGIRESLDASDEG